MKTKRTALKTDLFAQVHHQDKLNHLGDPLQVIAQHIDFDALAQSIASYIDYGDQAKGGRPPYPLDVMVRILVLKHLYNHSDEQMEYQLLDRMSYKRFCGLTDALTIPDRTTIWTFENRLGQAGANQLFKALDSQLNQQGYIARGRQIIDASLIPAPKQKMTKKEKALIKQNATPADWSPAKRRQKDLDASWTKKHGQSTFGYKLTVNVDNQHKLIRAIHPDTAAPHDTNHFDKVLCANTSQDIYADSGYTGQQREAELKQKQHRVHIQRKGKRNKPLSPAQQKRNNRIAKVRARVEHSFASIAHMGGKCIRTLGQARANFKMAMMALCHNIKRLTWLESQPRKAA
jgi:IS5 family transposase